MKVQVEISLYPLHCSDLTEPIQQFAELLKANDLKVEIGPMSTFISGDSQVVFFQGNWSEYEADRKKRLGVAAEQPRRIKYRRLTR